MPKLAIWHVYYGTNPIDDPFYPESSLCLMRHRAEYEELSVTQTRTEKSL